MHIGNLGLIGGGRMGFEEELELASGLYVCMKLGMRRKKMVWEK